MKLWSTALTLMAAFSTVTHAVPLTQKRSDLVKPSEDSFYQPPQGYEDKPLGTILKHRDTPNSPALLFLQQDVAKSIQLLYRTSNSSGAPEATVATVLVPHNADFTKLVSYQIAEDAASIDCAPSYAIQFGSGIDSLNSQVEIAAIDTALNLGWVVVTPDYEGPQAAFTAGIQAGHAVLDGVRAALDSESITGIKSDASVAFWGYSGGSLASSWAAELQPEYYPELEISGVAVGGLVPNITSVAVFVNKSPFVGLVPAGIMGLANEYPEFNAVIEEELIEETRDDFLKAGSQCLVSDFFKYITKDWFEYFKSGEDILYNPTVQSTLNDNAMGEHVPKAPFMIYHSKKDEIAPYTEVQKFYDHYCSKGVDITLNQDILNDHVTEMILGLPSALSWLKDRLNGEPVESGCRKKVRLNNSLSADSIQILGKTVFNLLLDLLGSPVGQSD